jgi:hypothetical protein
MSIPDLKKTVFFELLSLAGRVFIAVRYSENIDLGKKTFTEEEKRSGITLVFTDRMPIQWDDEGINTVLSFGSQTYRCFIPDETIFAIYSPDLRVQLTTAADEALDHPEPKSECTASCRKKSGQQKESGKLISVDFTNRVRRMSEKQNTDTKDT